MSCEPVKPVSGSLSLCLSSLSQPIQLNVRACLNDELSSDSSLSAIPELLKQGSSEAPSKNVGRPLHVAPPEHHHGRRVSSEAPYHIESADKSIAPSLLVPSRFHLPSPSHDCGSSLQLGWVYWLAQH